MKKVNMPTTARLSVPQAILVAGALIAGAILVSSIAKQQALQPQPDSAQSAEVSGETDAGNLARLVLDFEAGVDHARGAGDPKITIYEYSDIDCPFCHRFHSTLQEIIIEYADEVRWVYRHLPLDQLHPEARQKAIMAECVFMQRGDDVFWDVIDTMYAASVLSELPDYVALYGLDRSAYETCVASPAMQDRIQRDVTNALATKGGASIGTPWSIISLPDGTFIPLSGAQPTAVVKSILDAILAQAK